MSKTGDGSPTASREAESPTPSLGAGEPNLSGGNRGIDLIQGTGNTNAISGVWGTLPRLALR
jgi:hypothetical protein